MKLGPGLATKRKPPLYIVDGHGGVSACSSLQVLEGGLRRVSSQLLPRRRILGHRQMGFVRQYLGGHGPFPLEEVSDVPPREYLFRVNGGRCIYLTRKATGVAPPDQHGAVAVLK